MPLLELAAKAQLLLAADPPVSPPPPPPLLPNPGPMPLPAHVVSQGSSLIGWSLTAVGLLGILCFIAGCVLVMTGGFGGGGHGGGVGTLGKVIGGIVLAFSAASLVGGLVAL